MEEGSPRADVNGSVRRPGADLGTRCEIKNVNSVRFVQQAIEYEASRQIDILEDGGEIKQETRLFDSSRGETRPMRTKEESHDYRYFPDPDLLPLELDAEWVANIKASLPELPEAKKARFMADFDLDAYAAGGLGAERETAENCEAMAEGGGGKGGIGGGGGGIGPARPLRRNQKAVGSGPGHRHGARNPVLRRTHHRAGPDHG